MKKSNDKSCYSIIYHIAPKSNLISEDYPNEFYSERAALEAMEECPAKWPKDKYVVLMIKKYF